MENIMDLENCDYLNKKETRLLKEKLLPLLNRQRASKNESARRNTLQDKETGFNDCVYKELESLLAELKINEEAQSWILAQFPTIKNITDVENCDYLSRIEMRSLKEKISPLLSCKLMLEVEKSVEDTNCDTRNYFFDKFDSIWEELGFSECAKRSMLRRCSTIEHVMELEESDDLKTEELTLLKEKLSYLIDVSSNIEIDRVTASLVTTKQNLQTASSAQTDNSEVVVSPLIVCKVELQEGMSVEKYVISEDGAKYLCDFYAVNDENSAAVYYESSDKSKVIDFDRLDTILIKCIGLFGTLEAVVETLCCYIFPKKLNMVKIKEKLKETTGLFLLSLNCCDYKFIIFNSVNNTDYSVVEKESRAVHLLRYMCQLSNIVIMCLDDDYIERLGTGRSTQAAKTESRRSKFALTKNQLQQEKCELLPLGGLHINIAHSSRDSECEFKLFSSQSKMIKVNSRTLPPKIHSSRFKGVGNVEEIKTKLEKCVVDSASRICFEFKKKYLQQFEKEQYANITLDCDEKMKEFKNNNKEKIEQSISVSVALFFMQQGNLEEPCLTIELLQKYATAQQCSFWIEMEQFDKSSIMKVVPKKEFKSWKEKFQWESTEDNCLLLKHVLWTEMVGKKLLPENFIEKGFENTTWKDLFEFSESKVESSWLFGDSVSKKVFKLIEATEHFDIHVPNETIEHFLSDFVKLTADKSKDLYKLPSFVTYCQKTLQDMSQEENNKLLEEKVTNAFDEKFIIFSTETKIENSLELEKIIKIDTSYCRDNFCYEIEAKVTVVGSTALSFEFLALDNSQAIKMKSSGDEMLNADHLKFHKMGDPVHIEKEESLVAAFPTDENRSVLLILNKVDISRTVVFNLTRINKPIMNLPFGKKISACSFDSKLRLLALNAVIEPGVVNIFKFSSDYQTRQSYGAVDIGSIFGMNITNVGFNFCLQYNSMFLWVFHEGRLRKIDIKTSKLVKAGKINLEQIAILSCAPDGSCMFLTSHNGDVQPVMTKSFKQVEKLSNFDPLHCMFSMCNHIISVHRNAKSPSNLFDVNCVVVTGAQHKTFLSQVRGKDMEENNKSGDNKSSHWIEYVYWMLLKFPCQDLLSKNQQNLEVVFLSNKEPEKLAPIVMKGADMLIQKLKVTCKPMQSLHITTNQIFTNIKLVMENSDGCSSQHPLGKFLKKLITFIPVQLARCQSNQFDILQNGVPVSTGDVGDIFDLKQKINLGFYESIFSYWPGKIKVVSSMGKQSTGKSYTLNHVTGSSFNVAGVRCTDGCWMTVKEDEDCLYVVLDFEGLGSFERTEQDDMLLSLFNSALSTITIFKTDKRLDREVDQMFNNINLGSTQLKSDCDKLFRGKFMIVINDVVEGDVNDTPKEFREKINNIVNKSDNNFIKNLYNGDFEINAFPILQSSDYYEAISELTSIMKNEVETVFCSGLDFMATLKLLMAKLGLQDFNASFNRQQLQERTRFLRDVLPYAIFFGQISADIPKKIELDLRSLDNQAFRIDLEKEVNLIGVGKINLNDFNNVFEENQLMGIVQQFVSLVSPTPENFVQWREGLISFLAENISFRFERVSKWLKENVRKWEEDENCDNLELVSEIFDYFEKNRLHFEQIFKFCEEKCNKCFLKCTLIANHKDDEHYCTTDHNCSAVCDYCETKKFCCKMAFGHDGKHVCAEKNHVCGAECRFKELNDCIGECQKVTGHEDGHECSAVRHLCKEQCSLSDCQGKCQLDCAMEHHVHKCIKEQCIQKCCIPKCTNKCSALDHFHGCSLSEKYCEENGLKKEPRFLLEGGEGSYDTEEHFCGKEHQCDRKCEHGGFCTVSMNKTLETIKTFVGAHGHFEYKHNFVETGSKDFCRKKLEPFSLHHDGSHYCTSEGGKTHYCTVKCPTCENFCNKEFDHEILHGDMLHNTNHSNMTKCFFLANEDDIKVGDHRYKVGEPAVAEMCHMFCKQLGRGHVHIVECDADDPNSCVYSGIGDKRRHQTTEYNPDPEIPKDEVLHDEYWASIGFQDPCSELEIEEFNKCPSYCAAPNHKEDEKQQCELDVWHKPVTSLSEGGRTTGSVSKEGHLFPCSHPRGIYHFVLCLDDSGSMWGQPWIDLVSAVQSFVTQRQRTSHSDKISVLIYNSTVRIEAQYQPITSFSTNWLTCIPGGTDFSVALAKSDTVIGNHLYSNVKPILIFMSDGQCENGDIEMEQIASKYKNSHGLEVYTLGFGSVNFQKLRDLARLGEGEFIEAVTGMDLETAFVEISAKHPATIGVSSSQN